MNKLVHWAKEWFVTGPYSIVPCIDCMRGARNGDISQFPEYIDGCSTRQKWSGTIACRAIRCVHLGFKFQFRSFSQMREKWKVEKFQIKDYHWCSTAREVSYFLINLVPLLFRDWDADSGMASIASRKNTERDPHLVFLPHMSLICQFRCFPYSLPVLTSSFFQMLLDVMPGQIPLKGVPKTLFSQRQC